MMTIRDYPVAIIGGGPVGMAAAAQLAARNIPFLLFEAGKSVGASLMDWGHVRVFSPWRYNIDKAAARLLREINWLKPDDEGLPTGSEIIKDYLLPLSLHPRIDPHIHLETKVVSITRKGVDKVRTFGREEVPFMVQVHEGERLQTYEASGVIDASGTWQNPNPIGAGGVFAVGEIENSNKIAYRIPDIAGKDREKYAGKSVMVVGGGHSAINSLLELAKLKEEYPNTQLHWCLHTENLSSIYGGKEDDVLEARGGLGIQIERLVEHGALHIHTPFFIQEVTREQEGLIIKGNRKGKFHQVSGVDELIANTGARPDLSIFREVRVQVDAALECVPELAELIDPNIHSCGTVRPHGEQDLRQPEQNFYVVGVKSYGRAPTFLMATGYEQVRSIAAYFDGDIEAARRVELDLPETGVCRSGNQRRVACCGTSEKDEEVQINKPVGNGFDTPATNHNLNINTMEKVVDEKVTGRDCCGGAPTSKGDACCKLDEEKKEKGEDGCGCHTSPAISQKPAKVTSCC